MRVPKWSSSNMTYESSRDSAPISHRKEATFVFKPSKSMIKRVVEETINSNENPLSVNDSYLSLTDTVDSSYIDKSWFIPMVDEWENGIVLVDPANIMTNSQVSEHEFDDPFLDPTIDQTNKWPNTILVIKEDWSWREYKEYKQCCQEEVCNCSYLSLTDTTDTSYSGKQDFIPMVIWWSLTLVDPLLYFAPLWDWCDCWLWELNDIAHWTSWIWKVLTPTWWWSYQRVSPSTLFSPNFFNLSGTTENNATGKAWWELRYNQAQNKVESFKRYFGSRYLLNDVNITVSDADLWADWNYYAQIDLSSHQWHTETQWSDWDLIFPVAWWYMLHHNQSIKWSKWVRSIRTTIINDQTDQILSDIKSPWSYEMPNVDYGNLSPFYSSRSTPIYIDVAWQTCSMFVKIDVEALYWYISWQTQAQLETGRWFFWWFGWWSIPEWLQNPLTWMSMSIVYLWPNWIA